ncbi:hypothetical protein EJ04DRAFT_552221 [Polyplosphaeria fusca]|uniref:F-box domain-containing protein n=1 Tax=Polyplosphaeria fusca TaxID=682080 RepID=A0A9P4QW47_9PLEO|nr:hypothetical protein EJ04DRAFT_552221 [Polyplosphaeria fusca]
MFNPYVPLAPPPTTHKRGFLSAEDAIDIYITRPLRAVDTESIEAPRPCTAGQIVNRTFTSSLPSGHGSRITRSIPERRSSVSIPYGSPAAHDFEIPHLTKTPWEIERSKRNSTWRRTKLEPSAPSQLFKRLPREVYDCIMGQLEQLHFAQEQACSSCYLRDLHSLCLTNRAWDRAATAQMYKKVWLLTNEEHPRMPKLKIKGTSRLKLLRRTLRERQALAKLVRELHMPDFLILYQNASIEREEIVNLAASIVMACPNLERIAGFHIPYTYQFDRLSHALSTRRNLKERVWLLNENDVDSDTEDDEDPMKDYYHRANDPTERFLDLNSDHAKLTTLVLHQQQLRPNPLAFRAIVGTFRQYPSLRHLSLSNLPATTFTNMALNALPRNLQSLRLENLPGINDKGLQRFATSMTPTTLESLMLINLEISDVSIIASFLSTRLEHLKRFSLAQHKAPHLPSGAAVPSLQSKTLTYIHWEIRSQAGPIPTHSTPFPSSHTTPSFPFPNSEPFSCLATSLLSNSIKNALFPSLLTLRAPHDPQGLLQSLCAPRASALLPSDSSLLTSPPRSGPPSPGFPPTAPAGYSILAPPPSASSSLHSSKASTTSSISSDRADSPMSPTFPTAPTSSLTNLAPKQLSPLALNVPLTTGMEPARSRLAAQARILEGRRTPFLAVRVTDPAGVVRVDKMVYGFLGELGSRVVYEVRADGGKREREGEGEGDDEGESRWIVGVGDVVGVDEGGCVWGHRGVGRQVGVMRLF